MFQGNADADPVDVAAMLLPGGLAAVIRGALLWHELGDVAGGVDVIVWGSLRVRRCVGCERLRGGTRIAVQYDQRDISPPARTAGGLWGPALADIERLTHRVLRSD